MVVSRAIRSLFLLVLLISLQFQLLGGVAAPVAAAPFQIGGGQLTFDYQGWNDPAAVDRLRPIVEQSYNLLNQVYGPPSGTALLTIQPITQNLPGVVGYFDSSNNTIAIRRDYTDNDQLLLEVVPHEMAHAFHGKYVFRSGSATAAARNLPWEEGFADAVAPIVAQKINTTLTGEPSFRERFSLRSLNYLPQVEYYDAMNTTDLGGADWDSNLAPICYKIAAIAWWKVEREYPTFFSDFNRVYYKQLESDPTTQFNTQSLVAIAAQVAPNVEGLPFPTWYTQQRVLGSSPPAQTNLFLLPGLSAPKADISQVPLPWAVLYRIDGNGARSNLNGDGTVTFTDDQGRVLVPSNPAATTLTWTDSDGFAQANVYTAFDTGPGLIKAHYKIATELGTNVEHTYYFPYKIDPRNAIYGVVLNETQSGTVSATYPGMPNGTSVPVVHGVYRLPNYTGNGLVKITYTSASGTQQTRTVEGGRNGLRIDFSANGQPVQPGPIGQGRTDYTIPGGHFFTQAGDGKTTGYSITDSGLDNRGQTIKFWSEFQRLGGIAALGYPASQRFTLDGFTYQVCQAGLLQWRPELNRAVLANTFELLEHAGKDDFLFQQGLPRPITDDGAGNDFAKARQIRLGWLTNPQIRTRYLSSPNPAAFPGWNESYSLELYGLPSSMPERHGPFIVQRFQRVAFQYWLEQVPGGPAPGTITPVLGGDMLKAAGLIPQQATATEIAPYTPWSNSLSSDREDDRMDLGR